MAKKDKGIILGDETNETRSDKEDMIRRALMILIIIGSFPILQLPPKVVAQTPPPSEGAKVLIDDTIQALKANDTNKAQIHLGILSQQLPTFVNSTSLESVKVLLDDVSSSLKNNDIDDAVVHLNLVKQQLGSSSVINTLSNGTKESSVPQVPKIKANHPPDAFNQTIVVDNPEDRSIDLKGNDTDGDQITFSTTSNPTHGHLASFNPNTGVIIYTPDSDYVGEDSFSFQVTDNHNARSNIGTVSINVSSNTAAIANDNTAPVANSQTITTNVNTPKTITLSASDADSDNLTGSVTRPPTNGQLSEINQNTGEVTYTPANDYTGTDSFQFKVTDDKGADSNIAEVSIGINSEPHTHSSSQLEGPTPQPVISQPSTGSTRPSSVNYQVSIVSGASDLEDKAFSPNPIEVKVGDTVTWTNNDDQIHTVTSGTGSSDPDVGKDFDSSPGLKTLLSPNQTFSHKFDTAGEFPYFCQLHPAMVGDVIVTSGEATTSPLSNDRNPVIPVSPRPDSEPTTDHHAKSKRGGGDGERGPVGGYDTGFAVGAERANEAVDQFDNGQLKGIDADKSPPCPVVDEGNGYCRGFHDGWRKTVLDRLD